MLVSERNLMKKPSAVLETFDLTTVLLPPNTSHTFRMWFFACNSMKPCFELVTG